MKRVKKTSIGIFIIICVIISGSSVQEEVVQDVVTQCNDGIDNDADGAIDADGNPHDAECTWLDPQGGQWAGPKVCLLWDDEANPPVTENECDGI